MRTAILLICTVLAATSLAATRTPYSYHEDFTTWEFRDDQATTADWNTATGSLGLRPPQSLVVGNWNSPGNAAGVEVDGDVVYLADQAAGVQILDVSDPENPQLLGTYNTTGAAWGVDAEGDWAFVADGSAGLLALNVADPTAPTAGGVYDSPGTAYAVEVAGDLAYVADGAGGLRVVFVKNPLSPYAVGNAVTGGTAYDVDVDGDIAWVAAYDAGLVAVNIANPAAPVVVGTLNTVGTASAVAVDGDLAYVADGVNGLLIVNVTNPAAPVLRSTLALADRARDVAFDGDWVYVADVLGGMHVVDVHDTLHPVVIDTQDTPRSARAVALAGEHAYVADWSDGLRVLEIARRAEPLTPGTGLSTVYAALDIEVAGDRLYLDNAYNGIEVVTISDPMAPALLGTCDTEYAGGLDLAGDRLYVADHEFGLKVINVADPAHPVQVGSYAGTGSYYDVTVVGDYLLVANQATGLTVLNITNPAAPAYVAHLSTYDWAWEIVVAGNVAYIADYRSGLTIVDITDPAIPVLLANLNVAGDITGLDVADDHVYAASNLGMYVIDVHDPLAPIVVATYPTTSTARKVVVQGDSVYLTVGYSGLQILDISNPLAPALVDGWDPTSILYDVAVAGDVVFTALSTPNKLQPLQVRERVVGEFGVHAGSLQLDRHDEEILKVRLAAEASGTIAWALRAAEAAPWQSVTPDDLWHDLDTPGDHLVWQADLDIPSAPVCTAIDVAWLSAAPVVGAVTDIPADQGGRVRVRFARSAFDFADEATPITGYNLWRRVDDAALKRAVAAAPATAAFGDLALRMVDGRRFAAEVRGLPAGTWEVVSSFWAAQQDQYLVAATTFADSSLIIPWTAYCVTAHTATPSLWYASPPDSGYSVDNIAPAVPTHLALAASALTWDPAPEPDFAYSTVYGSNVPYLDDSAVRLGDTVVPTFMVAASYPNYLVTARDVAGNQSDAAGVSTATAVDDAPPARTALVGVAPNPFNPRTVVRYELAGTEVVTLRVYDAAGHLVRTLVDGVPQPAGRYEATWDGRTACGAAAAAGVYCGRLTAGDHVEACRMTLVR
jgi:hypothetical protein